MRTANIKRNTNETNIQLDINLDGKGISEISTGIAFLDHMIDQLVRHSGINLTLNAKGDTEVDFHHTTEDVAICIGEAIKKALGDKNGIARYGNGIAPMDEALTRVVIDICNRPYLAWRVKFPSDKVGDMDTELFKEFFQALVYNAGISLHIETFYGDNSHHIAESCFKALAISLKQAIKITGDNGVPSTKGVL